MALFLDKGDKMSELDKVSPVFPTIRLNGKDRELCYGFKFFSDMVKDSGDVQTGLKKYQDMVNGVIDPEILFDMVYKGLYYDEEITIEDVKKWMNRDIRSMGKLKNVLMKVTEAITMSMKDDSVDPQ